MLAYAPQVFAFSKDHTSYKNVDHGAKKLGRHTPTATKAAKAKTASKSTSTKKTTSTSKASTAKLASKSPSVEAKSAAVAKPTSTIVEGQQPVVLGPQMRKKELVDSIVVQTGMKKKFVKPVVEATLAALGAALSENRELNLQPFGRLKRKWLLGKDR